MRKLLLFLFLIPFLSGIVSAQDPQPVYNWDVSSRKLDSNRYELIFKTQGTAPWQLYAPNQVIDGVELADIVFADSSVYQSGPFIEPGKPITFKSSIFSRDVQVYEGPVEWRAVVSIVGEIPEKLIGTLHVFFGKNEEFNSDIPYTFTVSLEGGVAANTQVKIPSIDLENSVSPCGDGDTKGKSMFTIFLLGLLGGFIALLTPCVFPMIPVTVTFFTKKSQDRRRGISNAIIYGFCIFAIYVLITIPFHVAESARSELFNNISTNVWLNLLFFAVFVVFALSFFCLFEITLPSSIANRAGAKSGISDLPGIFFMAGTLAIVSFSCTGPILGTLLVGASGQGSADNSAWLLTAGAAGFGVALGLPFALFAMFPNWLQALPRSGGWMTTVKVVLGFVELALAVKFLANADNVQQWGIMKREVFVGLWVLIGLLTTLYLAGVLRWGSHGVRGKISIARGFFMILFAAFTIYLIPGMFNSRYASLKLLSGFPPPLSYSIYPHHVLHAKGVRPIVNDYAKALKLAKEENKPVLIDFTGWACVNCRRMEEKVWTDPTVDSLMRTKFIVVSLYVDERTKLPLKDRITYTTSTGQEESIITIGDKWTAFQKENFAAVSQPQYAILSADQKALTRSKFYTPDAGEFKEWLLCGLAAHEGK